MMATGESGMRRVRALRVLSPDADPSPRSSGRLDEVRAFLKSRRFFTLWFGLGVPPFLIGTVVASFSVGLACGLVTSVITAAWVYETFSTTCRRCSFYGSMKCGVPSAVVPLLFAKRSARSISVDRVRIHFGADVAMILYVNWIYSHFPVVFPLVAVGSFVGWLIVFRNKRFHGLLFRLRG
jgi:hypothetical protein